MPRIVFLSDTHNCNEQIIVPEGDILIHAGDATNRGQVDEIVAFNQWFSDLPHKHKIFVPGNHDWLFEKRPKYARSLLAANIIYLQDSTVEIEGLRIYASPWQPRFFDWAFNLNRGSEMAEKWKLIPYDIDVLITHGPPNGILDAVSRGDWVENTGCEELIKRVGEIAAFGRLKIHAFGHIHCGYGTAEKFGVRFINASSCDEDYLPTNPPIVVEL
ncbi:MAG: metallophosphatase domain-containing protein [Acidobacteriota bacterium]|nr:metallophosphatase domain-containing protein [Acidobacteriota bacterium]